MKMIQVEIFFIVQSIEFSIFLRLFFQIHKYIFFLH